MTIRDGGDDVFDTALSLKDRHGRRTSSRRRSIRLLFTVKRDYPAAVSMPVRITDTIFIE